MESQLNRMKMRERERERENIHETFTEKYT